MSRLSQNLSRFIVLKCCFIPSFLRNGFTSDDFSKQTLHKILLLIQAECIVRSAITETEAGLTQTASATESASRQRLFNELGWGNLYNRRWYRRLCHFFTLKTTQHAEYLFSHIPPERNITYNLRNPSAYPEKGARTARFSSTYFQNVGLDVRSLSNGIRWVGSLHLGGHSCFG